jgi:hypothetical protein
MNGFPAQLANAIPGNFLGQMPGAGVPKPDVSKQQPMLHLCTVIDNSAPAMKEILTEKLKQKITVDDNTFFKIPMHIYKDIADKVSEKLSTTIQQTFSGTGQDGTNLRISVLIQAKNNYNKLFKGTENLFSKTYDTYEDFEQAMKQQFDDSVEVEREKMGSNTPMVGGFDFGSVMNAVNNASQGGVSNAAAQQPTAAGKPIASSSKNCPEPVVKEVQKMIDDLYGKGTFKKKLLKIISHKLDKVVNEAKKTDNINILLDAATDKVTDAFKGQLDKFMSNIQSNNQFFNLCIISAIGPQYIEQYFKQRAKKPNQTQTLGQYIDALVIPVTEEESENTEPEEQQTDAQNRRTVQLDYDRPWLKSTVEAIQIAKTQEEREEILDSRLKGEQPVENLTNQYTNYENSPFPVAKPRNQSSNQSDNNQSGEIDAYGFTGTDSNMLLDTHDGTDKESKKYRLSDVIAGNNPKDAQTGGGAKRKTKQRKNIRRKRRTRKLRK